ncbi:LLM class flavin-dependent oxidoreductase [Gandjariella thermophila]|uniref:FMN-linked alkanal monooxygenase n=1 Tax=Gandjariella thermophila TaxID=1931992 RepID=A0A4D4JD81_9PSEU|nr:LLM class flavin-dependent oxidoreductase [Gandjariella thermophila]GDY32970.1 FMN-linked alkanal monooxygenase [Gandjariella thermophila]
MSLRRRVPLSVLDLAPVPSGSTTARALRNSLDLARRVERLGYTRYWVAEHHNMPGIASSSPAVLIGQLAAATSTLRVGSGGVMLPNHPPLVVAEQFGMLEALPPGRIDLGIGRAPGTDQATARALRRSAGPLSADDFPQQLAELVDYFAEAAEDGSAPRVRAVPAAGNRPPVWLLGSSGYSAQLAGLLGLPFAFAHHFSADNTLPALALYRESFRPSPHLDRPYAMVAAALYAANTDEHARWIAAPAALAFVHLRHGRPGPLPTPEEAASYPYTPLDEEIVRSRLAGQLIGGPDTVRRQADELLAATEADELMLTTMVHDHADRVRSYDLFAELAGLEPVEAPAGEPAEPAGRPADPAAGDGHPATVPARVER